MTHPRIDYQFRQSKVDSLSTIVVDGVYGTIRDHYNAFRRTEAGRSYTLQRVYNCARLGLPFHITPSHIWVEHVDGSPIKEGWYTKTAIGKITGLFPHTVNRRICGKVFTYSDRFKLPSYLRGIKGKMNHARKVRLEKLAEEDKDGHYRISSKSTGKNPKLNIFTSLPRAEGL